MLYWIGQGFGILGTAVDVTTPLYKKKWHMLIASMMTNVFYALNLVFLDRIGSGIFMFATAFTQGALNLVHTLRNTKRTALETGIFVLLYLGLGIYGLVTAPGFIPAVNAQNLLELLPILGAMLSMCFIASRDVQRSRWFYLGCACVWGTYYVVIGSSSLLGSVISAITAAAAIIKSRKRKTA